MRSLTAQLEDGYCSITIANHELITVNRFVTKNYTYLWKFFTNKHTFSILYIEDFFCEIFTVETKHCRRKSHLSACAQGVKRLARSWPAVNGFGVGSAVITAAYVPFQTRNGRGVAAYAMCVWSPCNVDGRVSYWIMINWRVWTLWVMYMMGTLAFYYQMILRSLSVIN